MTSNTQRTLKYLRNLGLTTWMLEKWNPYSKHRVDAWGILDILAMGASGIYGIQSCSDSGRSDHRKKLLSSPFAERWIDAGGILWLVTWGKHKNEKGREVWKPFVEPITKLAITAYKGEHPEERLLPGVGK